MYAGFDIGGTTARATLFDSDWQVREETTRSVRSNRSPDAVADLVADILRGWLESDDVSALESVGLGLAAQLDADRGLVHNAPNLGWRDVSFVEMLRDHLGDEADGPAIRLANDLNAILRGELAAGAVDDASDVLAVYVGTGVGGAIASDGRIVQGADGQAGEIGHDKIEVGGRLCGCGERGCVEAYAGGIHLEERVARLARERGLDGVWEDDSRESVDLAEADARSETDEAIDALWTEATDALALIVANACTLLDPGILLLGGGIVDHLDHYRRRLLSKIPPQVLEVVRTDLEIRSPELGDRAGVLGAARLAVDEVSR
jgi:glucokinase